MGSVMESFSFESQFKGAIRQRYKHEELTFSSVFLVTDLDAERAATVQASCQRFLSHVRSVEGATWRVFTEGDLPHVPRLLELIEHDKPDLVVTYRNLTEHPRYPRSSLGNYVDSVTQATSVPVLVLPVRRQEDVHAEELQGRLQDTERVIVVTDHLTDDPQLIRFGAEFTAPGGLLLLSHVEDEDWFERYMRAIERIPEIDNETARELILARLLKDARDFVDSAAEDLHSGPLDIRVSPLVQMGHTIDAYRKIIGEHDPRLIVADAKDPGRQAMSDLAYSMAVEFIDVPVLLL
jgi:hypothetical protein